MKMGEEWGKAGEALQGRGSHLLSKDALSWFTDPLPLRYHLGTLSSLRRVGKRGPGGVGSAPGHPGHTQDSSAVGLLRYYSHDIPI